MNVIIAAGGTAGHINPGIAIAQELKKRDSNAKITFIGTDYGLEKELVTKAGFPASKVVVLPTVTVALHNGRGGYGLH